MSLIPYAGAPPKDGEPRAEHPPEPSKTEVELRETKQALAKAMALAKGQERTLKAVSKLIAPYIRE